MKLDLHLVSWQRPKMTELVIRTIHRNTKPENFRLVVWDNGSDDQDYLQNLHDNGLIDELHLHDENIGLERARDLLLSGCTTDYFICVDNDCLPPPMGETDWTEKLLDLMKRHPDYAAISARTQVMIGTGNIFEEADASGAELVDFPHPGGSLRIMNTAAVKGVGGWAGHAPGRGAEERYICGKLREVGFKTAFAAKIHTLHLFGLKNTDRWGYPADWAPELTGHSDISHPALEQGDDVEEIKRFAGEELANAYR